MAKRRKRVTRGGIFRALSWDTLLELADVYWLDVTEDSTARTELASQLAERTDVGLEEVLLDLLSLGELQDVCARLGLPASGDSKARLARRILSGVTTYRPFDEAREVARSLGLESRLDWHRYCAGRLPEVGTLPEGVPANPHVIYRHEGWKGYGDWLGAEASDDDLAPPHHGYRSFEEARDFVASLNLLDFAEWQAYCRGELAGIKGHRPDDIPALPHRIYRSEGWIGYRHWLGLDEQPAVDSRWKPFKKARRFVWQLGLSDRDEWRAYCKGELPGRPPLPPDVPRDPARVYKGAWRGWQDWLGNVEDEEAQTSSSGGRRWRPFTEAREYAQGLGLKTVRDWRAFCRGELRYLGKRPRDVPAYPEQVYRAVGWKGYGDWLGTGSVTPRERSYRPFEEAREFARGLGLANEAQWRAFCRGDMPEKGALPPDVPARPEKVYRDSGWQGMRDWLANPESPRRRFRSFEQAREFARSLGLSTVKEWRAFCAGRLPDKGTLPSDVPPNPGQVYRSSGWQGYPDWLRTASRGGRKRGRRKKQNNS